MKTNKTQIDIYAIIVFMLLSPAILLTGCTEKKVDGKEHSEHKQTYYCPMHPQVTADKAGICPICHMDLVLQTSETIIQDGSVNLSDRGAKLAGVKTIPVTESNLVKEIKAYSVLEIPEQNRRVISAKFNGRIEQLSVAQTGAAVRKGDVLFTAYSPDVYRTASEYLVAKNAYDRNPNTEAGKLKESAKKRLELFGLTQQYIAVLEKTNEAEYTFQYRAPFSGVVLKKNIIEGAYINEGAALYELADISVLWSIADIFEADAVFVKQNMQAQVTFPALPGEVFTGKISFISPVVESESRTVKVRIELPNSSGKLRARMYGESVITINQGSGILIPGDAVIFTGKRNIVWVKRDSTVFEPREVQIGAKYDDRYLITSGLATGEEIVLNGNYLIDSESKLKSGGAKHEVGAATVSGEGTSSSTAAAPAYITKDNPLYKKQGVFNKFCPVLGDEVDADGPLLLYKGKIIGFCCKGCDKKFIKEPDKFLGFISKDGKKYLE